MRLRKPAPQHRGRFLLVSLLILGLARAPMPRADFHNVRHHDAAGEVCELHDHLLRWHPDAGRAADVAILHWHWLAPGLGEEDPATLGRNLPQIHAHVDEGAAIVVDDSPQIAADPGLPQIEPPQALPWSSPDAVLPCPALAESGVRAGPYPPLRAYSLTLATHDTLARWLSRWTC